jgi:hypothetical protein
MAGTLDGIRGVEIGVWVAGPDVRTRGRGLTQWVPSEGATHVE